MKKGDKVWVKDYYTVKSVKENGKVLVLEDCDGNTLYTFKDNVYRNEG